MAEILRVVGTVAGVAGISLGILLLIYRDFIQKFLQAKVFRTLSSTQATILIGSTIAFTFSIAVIGIFASFAKDNSTALFVLLVVILLVFIVSVLYVIKQPEGKQKSKSGSARLTFVKIEKNSSIVKEGEGHHSLDFTYKALHKLRFLLSNSGENPLVVKKVKLIIVRYEAHEYKFEPEPITIEAGPLQVFVIEAPKLTHTRTEYILQNKLIEIEPNGVVGYEANFSSDELALFVIKLAFEWIDAVTGKAHVSFSGEINLDFPQYNRWDYWREREIRKEYE